MVRRCIKKSETVCRRNEVKIIKFAQAHRNWSVDDRKRVKFSDGSYFVIGGENRTMIWRRYDEKYNIHQHETENTQKTIRVMVGGCITAAGVGSLTRVEGNITSEKYITVLENNLLQVIHEKFDDNSYIFMKDKARPHTARGTQTYLQQKNMPKILWPPQSPDLNPKKNLWLRMKREIEKPRKTFRSAAEVMETIRNVWDSISVDEINGLYKSLPERLKEVINMCGHRTKY